MYCDVVVSVVLCCEGKQYTLNVEDWDYIRILKGGTYINFVCMAIDKNANKSVLKTEDLRLQVCMYVCMYVCTYVRTYVCMYVCVHPLYPLSPFPPPPSPLLPPSLQTPDIALTIPRGGLKLYHPVEIGVEFVNPLRRSLTGGKFVLSGDGFVQDTTVNVP